MCTLGYVLWSNIENRGIETQSNTNPSATDSNTSKANKPINASLNLGREGRLNFDYPSDWNVKESFPNGLAFASQDFESTDRLRGIRNGSYITFYYSTDVISEDVTNELLDKYVLNHVNFEPDTKEYIDVQGYKGVKFTHSHGENRNSHTVIHFIANQHLYTIDQQYTLNSTNPYPSVLGTIKESVKFEAL